MGKHLIKSFWPGIVRLDWRFGTLLIILIGLPRFILVMQANATGQYQMVSIIFLVMMILPFVLLNRQGLTMIGLVKTAKPKWILYSILLGIGFSVIVYWIGMLLFGRGISNWFVYIAQSYPVSSDIREGRELFTYFIIYAITSMTFSPLGEELFYRGLVHQCFQDRFGSNRASQIDSAAFAVTHLAHFGIVIHQGIWQLLPIPAVLWVILMFMASRIFFICRLQSGSLLGPITSHAAFNFMMIYLIFYHIYQ